MNTSEINVQLKKIKFFIGTFPCDLLPNSVSSRPCGMIVNTDSSRESGEHWTSIILLPGGRAEYFDSFGLPPLVPRIQKYLEEMSPNGFDYSSRTLQHPLSITCGYFCIQFIKWRSLGLSYHCFVTNFKEDLEANDKILLGIKERAKVHNHKEKNVGNGTCARLR